VTSSDAKPIARRVAPSRTWLAAGLLWLAAVGLFAFAPRGATEAGAAAEAWDADAATSAAGSLGAGGAVAGSAVVGAGMDGVSAADGARAATSPDALGSQGALPAVVHDDRPAAPGPSGPAPEAVITEGADRAGNPEASVAPLDASGEPASGAAAMGDAPTTVPSDPPAEAAPSVDGAPVPPSDPAASEAPEAAAVPPPEPATAAPPALAAERPIVPVVDAALAARLGAIWADGQAQGRRADVFAKVGDSLSVSGFFLAGLGCDTSRLGLREDLRPLVELYRAAAVPGGASEAPCAAANPLTRRPVSASVGWLTAQVLAPLRGDLPAECAPPNHTALRCEVALVQPSMAIVTLGTNDVHMNTGVGAYAGALGRVVDELVALGVIPLLSTLPPRTDRPAMAERTNRYNDVVVAVAAERQVPLVNLWRDLSAEGLVRGGMEPDGVHLNGIRYGASFTEGGLRYGQNRRNALVLDALATVRRVVVEGGAADG